MHASNLLFALLFVAIALVTATAAATVLAFLGAWKERTRRKVDPRQQVQFNARLAKLSQSTAPHTR